MNVYVVESVPIDIVIMAPKCCSDGLAVLLLRNLFGKLTEVLGTYLMVHFVDDQNVELIASRLDQRVECMSHLT